MAALYSYQNLLNGMYAKSVKHKTHLLFTIFTKSLGKLALATLHKYWCRDLADSQSTLNLPAVNLCKLTKTSFVAT